MNKRFFSAILAVMSLLLSGCQLAQPEGGGSAAGRDRLVGVFITTEYIDLFDMEAWLQDNADCLTGGETATITDSSKYQGRIYAELTEDTVTNSVGEAQTTFHYTFVGLEGIILANYRMFDPNDPTNEDKSYWSSDFGEGLCDLHTSIKDINNETAKELTGSIYVSANTGEVIFYFNPVYQTPDGAVYLVPGSGLQVNSTLGGAASQSLSDSITETENGETKTCSSKIEVTIDFVEIAEKVILIQMDENNTEIGRAEFVPGEMPEEFTPMESAAYLIIEEYRESGVYRSLHQSGYDAIEIFFSPDGSLCIPDYTNINWTE